MREGWHYKDANTELIRRAVKEFNWQRVFLNTNVNEKVDIFNSTILNILRNFITHGFAVSDDKNPPWINNKIRALIQEKNSAFKSYRNNSSKIDLKCRLKYFESCVNAFIEVAEEKYYHNTINIYLQLHFQPKILEKSFKILIQT